MELRQYQKDLINGAKQAWSEGLKNVLLVSATGSGKTVTLAHIVENENAPTCVIAHRQELVSQLSLALAREGITHRIIGPDSIVRLCVTLHMAEIGRSYFSPSAKCAVAGVDTLVRRTKELQTWFPTVQLWVIDEAHHCLSPEHNKWGMATSLFPNAKGLGVTATPLRADGKGLGAHHDGVFHSLVEGPSMKSLIDDGYLCKYRIFAPPSDLDLSEVKISVATGDYSVPDLVKATRKSHVLGDVVEHYLKLARGKRGITFATDVQSAKDLAERFRQAGVPAVALDAKSPDAERVAVLRKFKAGEILQVVNVDLFSEGTDIPAVEVVSFARATQSYGMFVQAFGRALRLMEGKEYALIIDHVGNVVTHGLPDAPRKWSLDRREKRAGKQKDPDVIPVKSCPECTAVYERIYRECPYCGFAPIPSGRSAPEQVDGDLAELDAQTLARMRGEIARVNMTMEEKAIELGRKRVPLIGQRAGLNRHRELLSTHKVLADQLAWWGGHRSAEGMPDSEIQRRFYFRFGIDVLSAQALPRREAEELIELLALDNYNS